MTAILTDEMEHESRIREALRVIAVAEPTLAPEALDAMKRGGAVLQRNYDALAAKALTGEGLSQSDRRKVVGLVRISEPETFDAMLRVRMSKDQLAEELPTRAKRAGFGEVSRYVRWVLFGSGTPDAEPVTTAAPVEVRDNWNEAIDAAIQSATALGGRPRLESVLKALAELKR